MKTSSANQRPDLSAEQIKSGGKSKWLGHIEWFCLFSALFAGYLWYSSPIKTTAQFYFRLGLLTAGGIGYLGIQVLKWYRMRNASST